MKKESKAALDLYFSEGESWSTDRNMALRNSRRVAWWVAGGAALIAVLEAVALIILTPLKTVVPYTLMVDRQTGFVQALKPLEAQLVSSDRALTQSFLAQYVIAREAFDIDSLQNDYRKVALWSAGTARTSYLAGIQVSNPDSPLARYPRSTIVDVRIRSVTPLAAGSAMVRFDTLRRDATGQGAAPQPWVAVLRYEYSGEPMSLEDRLVNPLGFRVTRYRRSMEALPQPQLPRAAADTPDGAALPQSPQTPAMPL